jgi:hypothetical protein
MPRGIKELSAEGPDFESGKPNLQAGRFAASMKGSASVWDRLVLIVSC